MSSRCSRQDAPQLRPRESASVELQGVRRTTERASQETTLPKVMRGGRTGRRARSERVPVVAGDVGVVRHHLKDVDAGGSRWTGSIEGTESCLRCRWRSGGAVALCGATDSASPRPAVGGTRVHVRHHGAVRACLTVGRDPGRLGGVGRCLRGRRFLTARAAATRLPGHWLGRRDPEGPDGYLHRVRHHVPLGFVLRRTPEGRRHINTQQDEAPIPGSLADLPSHRVRPDW